MKPSLYSTVTKFLWRKWCFLKKEIVFKKKRNLYKNFTVWLQDGDILRKSMMYILLSWSSRWRRKRKELLLSWILPQFTTKSQNLLHVISGELRKIGSSEQKIEMIFLLLQRALISYFSFSSSILSNFLANVINIRSNNKFLLLQFKQKFLFEKKIRNEIMTDEKENRQFLA